MIRHKVSMHIYLQFQSYRQQSCFLDMKTILGRSHFFLWSLAFTLYKEILLPYDHSIVSYLSRLEYGALG